jgi:hypothetical protein
VPAPRYDKVISSDNSSIYEVSPPTKQSAPPPACEAPPAEPDCRASATSAKLVPWSDKVGLGWNLIACAFIVGIVVPE